MTGIVLCGGASSRMGADKGLLSGPGGDRGSGGNQGTDASFGAEGNSGVQGNLDAEGSWAAAALRKLQSLGIPVALSIRIEQRDVYASLFPGAEFIFDCADIPVQGPLLALLSCHRAKPSEDLLVLACDMPLIRPLQLQRLWDMFRGGDTSCGGSGGGSGGRPGGGGDGSGGRSGGGDSAGGDGSGGRSDGSGSGGGGSDAYAYIREGRFEPLCALYTRQGLSSVSDAGFLAALRGFSLQHVLRDLRTKAIEIPPEEISCFRNFNSPADLAALTQTPPSP